MKDKSFKAPVWMLEAVHKAAWTRDERDAVWIRRALLDALLKDGFDPSQVKEKNNA